ncbi:MAG TPA: hypothetical protein VN969_25320 [Streptosporangiaceae bacterium]|jgi:hypothetical protein|nr:hypothetical protein [Streptosporangiaceae bacterium]
MRFRPGAIVSVSVIALFTALGLPAISAAADTSALSLRTLAFSQSTVDATGGSATVTLSWTIADSNTTATDVAGDVFIQMSGGHSGSYIGIAHEAPYDLTGALSGFEAGNGSGTAQLATFSYTFTVPQYASAATAHWAVSQVTAKDNLGTALTLSGQELNRYHANLTATELVDSTPPQYSQLAFASPSERPYRYNSSTGTSLSYSLYVTDSQSGFWQGEVRLGGPHGQTASGRFDAVYSVSQGLDQCGTDFSFGTTAMLCTVTVNLPADAAAGTWAIDSISVTDNAGNTTRTDDLNALPVTVTSNAVVSASGFAASPNPVNNWAGTAPVALSMTVAGARQGVAAVYVDSSGGCSQTSTVPVAGSGGTISVPMNMGEFASSCKITGIAVVDGAGDVALYGSEYGAPDPGVTITQVPDTTPPVATAASLSPTSIAYSADSQFVTLTITVDDAVAPVNQVAVFLYNSAGQGSEVSFGGVTTTLSGPVTVSVSIPAGEPAGSYTVGFQLVDTGGLAASYGTPGASPVPGGPLTLTITS